MIRTKVSFITLTICCALVFVGTISFSKLQKQDAPVAEAVKTPECTMSMEQIRLNQYEHVQPLILTNVKNESPALRGMRMKVEQYIADAKSHHKVEEVSVYFRKMEGGDWFNINPNVVYNPASMSKIIYLLTYLKEAEQNPGVLKKTIYFAKHYSEGNSPNIKNITLKENSHYSVAELLTYMIKYSDNDATMLLSANMKQPIYHQLFKDLNIPPPPTVGEYYITTEDFSKFFRVLFNATYVRPDLSEYGLKLLTLSEFADGIRKPIDPKIEIAHKFGERIIGNKTQLHEFGIVYIKGSPYLLGVMTRGNSLPQLSQILADLSGIVYSEYTSVFLS